MRHDADKVDKRTSAHLGEVEVAVDQAALHASKSRDDVALMDNRLSELENKFTAGNFGRTWSGVASTSLTSAASSIVGSVAGFLAETVGTSASAHTNFNGPQRGSNFKNNQYDERGYRGTILFGGFPGDTCVKAMKAWFHNLWSKTRDLVVPAKGETAARKGSDELDKYGKCVKKIRSRIEYFHLFFLDLQFYGFEVSNAFHVVKWFNLLEDKDREFEHWWSYISSLVSN